MVTTDGVPAAAGPHGVPAGLRLVGAVVLLSAAVTFAFPPLLPVIGGQLELSAGQLGMITAALAAGRLVTDLPAGWLADQVPARVALGAAGVLLAAGAGLIAAAAELGPLLVGAGVVGVASAATNTVAMTSFARGAQAARRGRALAAYTVVLLVGQSFGPGGAGLLTQASSWRTAMTGGALLGVIVAGVCLGAGGTLLGAPPRSAPSRPTPAAGVKRPRGVGGRGLTRGAQAALLLIPAAEFAVLGGIVFTVAPILGATVLGLPSGAVGAALAGGGIARLAGAAAVGRLSDRLGRKAVLLPAQGIMAAATGLLALGHAHPAVWLAAVLLVGAATQGIAVGASMLADATPPGDVGRQVGTYRLAGDAGLLVGPLACGWLLDHVGVLAAVAPALGLLGLSVAATRWLVPETYRPAGARSQP